MEYINIKEASEKTGKSIKTIRRLAEKVESKKYIKVQKGKMYIDANYLYGIYKVGQMDIIQPGQVDIKSGQMDTRESGQMDITKDADSETDKGNYLQEVLKVKDETIKVLSNQVDNMAKQLDNRENTINQLIERSREQNIIIQSLQDKLKLLPAPAVNQEKQEAKKQDADIWLKIAVSASILFMIMLIWYLFKPA